MADMPSIPSEAIAPLDYSGTYGKVAGTLAAGGQYLDKAMNDYATFEKSREKEQMRQQALLDLYKHKDYMKEVVRPDIDAKDLGRGWAQMEASGILYDQLKTAGATLPDRKSFDQATFMASEKAWDASYEGLKKFLESAEKQKSETAAGTEMGAVMKDLPPGATREEIARTLQEKAPGAVAQAGKNTMEMSLASGAKSTDLAKIRVARDRLSQSAQKMKQDRTYQDFQMTFNAAVKNGNWQVAHDKLLSTANDLEAEGKVLESRGLDGADKKYEAAQSLRLAHEFSTPNAETMQEFAATAHGVFKEKYPKFDKDGASASPGGGLKPTKRYNPTTGDFEYAK